MMVVVQVVVVVVYYMYCLTKSTPLLLHSSAHAASELNTRARRRTRVGAGAVGTQPKQAQTGSKLSRDNYWNTVRGSEPGSHGANMITEQGGTDPSRAAAATKL